MADLDWQQHDADISSFVKKTTVFYLRTEASTGKEISQKTGILLRNNYATPRLMMRLLDYLAEVTRQVNGKLQVIRGLCLAGGMDFNTCKAGSTTYGPILTDYEAWKGRLESYFSYTEAAMARDPDASGDEDREFWDHVTKPLLLGFYPGMKRQRRLDAVSPLVMAWQLEVAADAYEHARAHFWTDLKKSALDVGAGLTGFGGGLVLLALGAAALGYGLSKGRR